MTRRLVLILLLAVPIVLVAGSWLWVKSVESRRWARLERRVADLAREADRRRCPRPVLRGTPLPGDAWEDYLPALELVQNMNRYSTIQMYAHSADESNLAEVRALVQPYVPAVERMQSGTRRADARRIRLDEREQFGVDFEESWLNGTLSLAYAASCRARWLAAEGRIHDAAELLLDLCKYGQDVVGDGSELAMGLGETISEIALEGIRSLLARNRVSSEDCLLIDRDLAQLDATFPRFGPVLLSRLEYFGTWILKGCSFDTLHQAGCIPAHVSFKQGWREAFSQPLMAVAGFDQTDAWTARLLSAAEESVDEEEARWKKALEERSTANNNYFRLFTNSDGMPRFQSLRTQRAELRLLRMAAHYRATGEPLDLKLPGFGTTVEPKALYFWGPFVRTLSLPRSP